MNKIKITVEYETPKTSAFDTLLKQYEDIKKSDGVNSAGHAAYVERNYLMIDESKYAIFSLNENRKSNNKKSGTMIAYQYAIKREKAIHNVV